MLSSYQCAMLMKEREANKSALEAIERCLITGRADQEMLQIVTRYLVIIELTSESGAWKIIEKAAKV